MRTFRSTLLVAVLALSGCDGAMVSRKAPESIRLSDGTIVAGAEGWCVDTATSKAGPDTAVVVLGSCAAIAHNASAPRPDVPGIVMVSLEREAGVVPGAKQLAAFLATEQGRAVLALDGRAESVRILETVVQGDRLYLRVEDDSVGPGTASETWRALFDLGGRFASVSLYAQAGEPIGRDEGFATLSAQVAELYASNS
jgi:hypothetical protein